MIALSIEGLVVERAGRRLLDGIDLDVSRGAWVSVVARRRSYT